TRARGLELVTRYLRPGLAVEARGPPRFLGNPRERALLSDPGGIAGARPLRRRDAAFRPFNNVGSREETFPGSITRPAHSLSTLRSPGHPRTTQDSLPAAGQLCRTGLATRRVPAKGFRVTSLPPFPSFPGALKAVLGQIGGVAGVSALSPDIRFDR